VFTLQNGRFRRLDAEPNDGNRHAPIDPGVEFCISIFDQAADGFVTIRLPTVIVEGARSLASMSVTCAPVGPQPSRPASLGKMRSCGIDPA
jgi:hypothetical protein